MELHLNPDGSVAPESKVISSPSPDKGRDVLLAAFQCQPYLLPAEKYASWEEIVLSVVPTTAN